MSEKETLQEAAQDSVVYDSDDIEAQAPDVEQEEQESGAAESAADTGDRQEEKVAFDEKQQAWLNSREAMHKRRERELQEERDRIAREAEELRQKLPKDTRPEIPPPPDPYDDNFAEKIKARDEAIQKAAEWDARERFRSEQELAQQREALQRQQQEQQRALQDFVSRSAKLGLSEQELEQASQVVGTYGLHPEAGAYIRDESQGPLILAYLAKNPTVLTDLRSMPPYLAVAKLAAEIKPQAIGARKKPKLPPDPHETLDGLGAREKERGPAGATYE